MKQNHCRISEIFYSVQGEANTVGWPTVFVRLTGCPLRCGYCDTEYAFKGGEILSIEAILADVAKYSPQYVCVTGGEPLAQPQVIGLMGALVAAGYRVSIETSGAISVADIPAEVEIVMDLKTPASGEQARNDFNNIDLLKKSDCIKFVICDRDDYDWAKSICEQYQLFTRYQVLFSPVYKKLTEKDLAEWILADKIPVRLNIQLHKFIWGDAPGH